MHVGNLGDGQKGVLCCGLKKKKHQNCPILFSPEVVITSTAIKRTEAVISP